MALFPFAAGWGVFTIRCGAGATPPKTTTNRRWPASCESARSNRCRPTACRIRLSSRPTSSTPGPARRTSGSAQCFSPARDADGKPQVTAFTATCPHLGCAVEFNAADDQFECPCHESGFAKDGEKLFGPSLPRPRSAGSEARRRRAARRSLGRSSSGFGPACAERIPSDEPLLRLAGPSHRLSRAGARRAVRAHSRRRAVALRLGQHARRSASSCRSSPALCCGRRTAPARRPPGKASITSSTR